MLFSWIEQSAYDSQIVATINIMATDGNGQPISDGITLGSPFGDKVRGELRLNFNKGTAKSTLHPQRIRAVEITRKKGIQNEVSLNSANKIVAAK